MLDETMINNNIRSRYNLGPRMNQISNYLHEFTSLSLQAGMKK
jgi:hypothetical protein